MHCVQSRERSIYRLLEGLLDWGYTLSMQFPILFKIWQKSRRKIGYSDSWCNGVWDWNIVSNVLLSELSKKEFDNLLNIMYDVSPISNLSNKVVWWGDANGYSIKSAFLRLSSLLNYDFQSDTKLNLALNCICKSNVPSNIQVFVWRLFLIRLQIRDKLAKRGVISSVHSLICLLCLGPEEFHCHLFLKYSIVVEVWCCILDWAGLCRLSPWIYIYEHLLFFDFAARERIKILEFLSS